MDEQYVLTTPESVPISYELAGVGSRFVAALLDGLIMAAVQIGLLVALAIAGIALGWPSWLAGWGLALFMLISLGIQVGYSLLFEITWSGQTPGKHMTGIRVVQDSGAPITATAAVIRNVVRLVDFLPAYYIIGVCVMLVDRQVRRLGDIAAGTICVKERRDLAVEGLVLSTGWPGQKVSERIDPVAGQTLANIDRLSYDDRRLVREYLRRRYHLQQEPSQALAERIADHIAARLGVPRSGESADRFLVGVNAALERRGQ